MKRVLHISFSDNGKGGGIYFYLKEFIKIQKEYGINCQWITTTNKNFVLKKKELLNKIISIEPEIIHIHGIWTVNTRIIPELKKISKNIIVSPHGMLNIESLKKSYLRKDISFNYLKKKLYLLFFEKNNLNHIKYFHALTEAESKEIRSIFPNKPIKVISTGFKRINTKENYKVDRNLKNIFKKPNKILLFLGRLDPQKGLAELITAWNQLVNQAEIYNWTLLIAGFGEGEKIVISSANKSNSRIIFNGPVFGEEKNFILQNSKGFILPSYNEGLPISILEALSFKTTCLISEQCNMKNLLNENISLKIKISKNKNNIKEVLMKLFKLSEKDLDKREKLGIKYLDDNHKWDKIISETNTFYKDLYKD